MIEYNHVKNKLPLWVLGSECPPSLATKDKSSPNLLINHSTAGPDYSAKVFPNGYGLVFSPLEADL
jgi:hypothetical protein